MCFYIESGTRIKAQINQLYREDTGLCLAQSYLDEVLNLLRVGLSSEWLKAWAGRLLDIGPAQANQQAVGVTRPHHHFCSLGRELAGQPGLEAGASQEVCRRLLHRAAYGHAGHCCEPLVGFPADLLRLSRGFCCITIPSAAQLFARSAGSRAAGAEQVAGADVVQ